jgi:hypothetical protein
MLDTFDWYRFNKPQKRPSIAMVESCRLARADDYTACMARGQGTHLRKCGK